MGFMGGVWLRRLCCRIGLIIRAEVVVVLDWTGEVGGCEGYFLHYWNEDGLIVFSVCCICIKYHFFAALYACVRATNPPDLH